MKPAENLKVIVIISDGIPAHVSQSRGVALWLSKLTGADIVETEIPNLTRTSGARARAGGRRIVEGTRRDVREWLSMADGDALVRKVGQWFAERDIREGSNEALVISSGSMAALYNLSIGYIWRCACATIMTPGITGTDPFDFAIVPEHDFPPRKPNVLVTQGLPNEVRKDSIKREGAALLAEYPSGTDKIWSLLIGGDNADYTINSEHIKKYISHIMKIAEHEEAGLYIAVLGRVSADTMKTIKLLASRSPAVKHLFIESETRFNPVQGMLGLADEVFCTEDLAAHVFEAVTAGHRAVLVRVGRRRGIRGLSQRIIAALVNTGAVDSGMLWGGPKFDMVFDRLARHNMLVDFREWIRRRHELRTPPEAADYIEFEEFNEAKRAAQWIFDNWQR